MSAVRAAQAAIAVEAAQTQIRLGAEPVVRAGLARCAVRSAMNWFRSHAPSRLTAEDLEGGAATAQRAIMVKPEMAPAGLGVLVEFPLRTRRFRLPLLTLLLLRIPGALAAQAHPREIVGRLILKVPSTL